MKFGVRFRNDKLYNDFNTVLQCIYIQNLIKKLRGVTFNLWMLFYVEHRIQVLNDFNNVLNVSIFGF